MFFQNNLVFIVEIKKLNLPLYALTNSHLNNCRVSRGKYKGWYAIKL